MTTYLCVTAAAASLQADLDTQGSVAPAPGMIKSLLTNRLPDGWLRLVVYGLDLSTFTGHFATVDATVNAIRNVVVAGPDGQAVAGARVLTLGEVQEVNLTIS